MRSRRQSGENRAGWPAEQNGWWSDLCGCWFSACQAGPRVVQRSGATGDDDQRSISAATQVWRLPHAGREYSILGYSPARAMLWSNPGQRSALPSPHRPRYKVMLQRLRRARRLAGLTQVEVARALGTSQAYISKCEQGERRIDPIELSDFAQLYGAPLHTLLPASTAPRLVPPGYRPPREVAERIVRPVRRKTRSQAGQRSSTKRQRPS
jgi:transcriptional regulator with XRE-family HTH domain